ncbi:MAG: DUF4147 domain-containing protein [bacterium]|nr:DUF4147 domain-containing protein [bacterium]
MNSNGPYATLREDALAAFQSAVGASQPDQVLADKIVSNENDLFIAGKRLCSLGGRRILVAVGKAAPSLCSAFLRHAPTWPHEIVILAPHGVSVTSELVAKSTVLRGAHPIPDQEGEISAHHLLTRVGELNEDDSLLVLLSGGSSALLAAPRTGITLEDVQAVTRTLITGGAPIGDLNTVRRELLVAAGGGLALAAYPAQVQTLVLSDVLGDSLPDIASGPTVPSPTTARDAVAVFERFGGMASIPRAVHALLEKRSSDFQADLQAQRSSRAQTLILANNQSATRAAAQELNDRGYQTIQFETALTGEASARGRQLAGLAMAVNSASPLAIVFGGETTVTVTGQGRGGRNQELALAAAQLLHNAGRCAVLAAGTDGIDGHSPHAGAIVDPSTWGRILACGIDPESALADNDSASALAASEDAIIIGPTGTNVCDVTLLLIDSIG